MKYFGFVSVFCIFQSIRLSFACYGYTFKIMQLDSGDHNHIKFDNDYRYKLTDDCKVFAGGCLFVDRPYKSALISMKAKKGLQDIFTIKKRNLCTLLSHYKIFDMECPFEQPRRVCFEYKERGDVSEYEPFLDFFAGNVTFLVRLDYDDVDIPDVYSVVFNLKKKNSS